MLPSWLCQEGFNKILRSSVPVVFAAIIAVSLSAPVTAHSSFTKSSLWLGADKQQVVQTQAMLEETTTAVYENYRIDQICADLRKKFGMLFLPEANTAKRTFTVLAQEMPLSEMLSLVSAQTKTFLVFRDGYLLFSDRAVFKGVLSRELTPADLQALSDAVYGGTSEVFVGRKDVQLKLSRADYLRIRETFNDLGVELRIVQTDAVVFSGFSHI